MKTGNNQRIKWTCNVEIVPEPVNLAQHQGMAIQQQSNSVSSTKYVLWKIRSFIHLLNLLQVKMYSELDWTEHIP